MEKPLIQSVVIPLVVDGHYAKIVSVTQTKNSLSVIVMFDPPVARLIAISVRIPKKRYSKEAVIMAAEKKLRRHIEEMNNRINKATKKVIKEMKEENSKRVL